MPDGFTLTPELMRAAFERALDGDPVEGFRFRVMIWGEREYDLSDIGDTPREETLRSTLRRALHDRRLSFRTMGARK